MNNAQRKQLASLAKDLQTAMDDGMPLKELKLVVETVLTQVETMRDEEQDKFDNMPEGLQASSKGEAMEQAIEMLESIISDLESVDMAEDGEEDEVGNVLSDAISNMESI